MKTTIEMHGFEIVIEETEAGLLTVSALKDGEVVEEFSLEGGEDHPDFEGESEGEEIKGFGEFGQGEEEDFEGEEDFEEGEDLDEVQDVDDEEELEGEEDLDEEEEDEEEEAKLESFQSFINKKRK
jgi:hypothetical protein